MKQLVRNVKIIGTGSYVPEQVYTNAYLETIVPTNDAWIYENVGIRERHIAREDETTSDLAAQAGLNAIKDAGLVPEDIDLIIVATATSDRKAPSTAAIVQHKIKAKNAVAFDITAVCSGFLYATSIGNYNYFHALRGSIPLFSGRNNYEKKSSLVTALSCHDLVGFLDGMFAKKHV